MCDGQKCGCPDGCGVCDDCGANVCSGEECCCHEADLSLYDMRALFEADKIPDRGINIPVFTALSSFIGHLKENIDAQANFTDPETMVLCNNMVDAAIVMALVEQVSEN